MFNKRAESGTVPQLIKHNCLLWIFRAKAAAGINKSKIEVMPATEFMQNIERLKEYIEDFNYIDIIELLEKMMGSASAETQSILNDVYDNVQNFEYDTALEILNNVTEN